MYRAAVYAFLGVKYVRFFLQFFLIFFLFIVIIIIFLFFFTGEVNLL